MPISTAKELKEYCLRKCGSPVINVEIATEQQDDCVEETLEFFSKYHMDGNEETIIIIPKVVGESEYTLDSDILSVTEIIEIGKFTTSNNEPSFTLQWEFYQEKTHFRLDMVGYEIARQWLDMLRDMYVTKDGFEFNPVSHKFALTTKARDTSTIALKVYKKINPYNYGDVYNNDFVKKYCTALFNIQWGKNLNKYTGVPIPGGGTLNSEAILQEGREDKEKLEEKIREEFELPIDMLIG